MTEDLQSIIYFICILFSIGAGIFNLRYLERATKKLLLLFGITLISEVSSYLIVHNGGNKNPVFHVFNVLELYLITSYFLEAILGINARLYHIAAGILALLLAYLNMQFLQPITQLNSNFISVEGFLGIAMSLFAMYTFLLNDAIPKITRFIHFWIWTVLFLNFSSTFCFWSFVKYLYHHMPYYYDLATTFLTYVNILGFLSFAVIFLFAPKLDNNLTINEK